MTPSPMRLGFACSWWHPRETTWSYTPISLHRGLQACGVAPLDIEAQPPLAVKALAAGLSPLVTQRPWKYTRAYRALEAARVRRTVRRLRPDAVIEIADLLVPTSAPSFGYQDMGFQVALDHHTELGPDLVSTFPTDLATLRALAEEQARLLPQLDGMLAMSGWYRGYLIAKGLLPATRIDVVGAGVAPWFETAPLREPAPARERRRLLFVGGDFIRKGGDQVLEAVGRLRRSGSADLRLTVAGPAHWPLPGAIPEWVDFLGALPREQTQPLFGQHDLMVMPSRFEAYGIVFLEARASGIPCIGRDAFAMPELVEPGHGGLLWDGRDIDTLAALILGGLQDDALQGHCAQDARRVAREHSWASVAARILSTLERRLGRQTPRPGDSAADRTP